MYLMHKHELNMLLIIIVAFLTIGGFYFVLNKIGTLSTDVDNLKTQLNLAAQNGQVSPLNLSGVTSSTQTSTSSSNNSSGTNQTTTNPNSIKIPTAILFQTQSSATLSPQTTLTVTIPDVIRDPDGTLTVDVKIFTNGAASYSALDPKSVIQILNVDGSNVQAMQSNGQFDSLPPQSSATGNVIFKTDPSVTSIILQVVSGDSLRFYQFDFTNGNYKETVVG